MNINSKTLGLEKSGDDFINALTEKPLLEYIDLKLAFLGCPTVGMSRDPQFKEMLEALLQNRREAARHAGTYLCPADRRIHVFLQDYLQSGANTTAITLPSQAFVLDRHGLARELSLPQSSDEFESDIVRSYRVQQGVLHNPQSDRRTTKGVFHIAEGGLPIPDDKIAVPKNVFANLLQAALAPPEELLRLPLTAAQKEQAHCWVSLLLRPLVCPGVPGAVDEKTMEIRFFAPGTLVSNLDFVESIFGNAGDPYLPKNDAGLDIESWSGHTGCVILAPHLIHLSKKELGLPHFDAATPRQREDGMCWQNDDEKYNNGQAFKITCRDERGVMVTLIADNYFGYCKKEVKTQISYAANLSRLSEEEHAGGALVCQAYDLGEEYSGYSHAPRLGHSWTKVLSAYSTIMDVQPEGYGIDKNYPDIIYVPEDVHFDLQKQKVSWPRENGEASLKLSPHKVYVRPSGYRVQMEKLPGTREWRLSGTVAEGTVCHKPCTVSGGGKSEISKPISDAIIQGPVFVSNFETDFEAVEAILNRDYSDRFSEDYKSRFENYTDSRPVLSPRRSLGSVIKLLTPASRDFTPQYNDWLKSIPQYIKELVFVIKRFYKPQWRGRWRQHFGVDIINGIPGNELKYDGRKLIANYLRVGYDDNGAWRVFGLRYDFHPAAKLAFEDDISVSAIVETEELQHLDPDTAARHPALKFVQNCEYRLFQRPDEAIHRGYDKQTEADFSRGGNFFSNYEPLPVAVANELIEDSIGFDEFSEPLQELIETAASQPSAEYFVSTAHPRLVDGKPSQNPRYLQLRTDIAYPRDAYLAKMCTRFFRRIPLGKPVHFPVNAVLPGRRNNPPDPKAGISALAVFNPIHYLELPEAFLEFICSMTGKSPSTTGAGSEGALTKGPFNALLPIHDLNNALLSYAITGYDIFLTAAGYIGPHVRMDHDISFLVPEVWCRMSERERDPQFLMEGGYLEKCEDITFEDRLIPTSRLGYRITSRFVKSFFGRIFNLPHLVFTEEMLRPEKQSLELVVEGMDTIVATQNQVAQHYFNDGGIELACPPLRALLHIMRDGHYEGKPLSDPAIRQLFTREQLLSSDWYQQFIAARQAGETALWKRHENYLREFLEDPVNAEIATRLDLNARWEKAKNRKNSG